MVTVAIDRINSWTLIIGTFATFHALFILKSINIAFFTVVLAFSWILLHDMDVKTASTVQIKKDDFWNDVIDNILPKNTKSIETGDYFIRKGPKDKLVYLKRSIDIQDVLYDLGRVLKHYDVVLFAQILTYANYFLKIHYNLMIEKYDPETYMAILIESRRKLLNLMSGRVPLNLPSVSRIVDVTPYEDVDSLVENCIKRTQAYTMSLVQLVVEKYGQTRLKGQEYGLLRDPSPLDPTEDTRIGGLSSELFQ